MAATQRQRFVPGPGLLRCSVCRRDLPHDAFITMTVKDKRCKPGHEWTGLSYDCRECRSEAKRQARARAKGFPTWEAWQQAKMEEKKAIADVAAARVKEREEARARRADDARRRALAVLADSDFKPRTTLARRERAAPKLIAIPDLLDREIKRFRSRYEEGDGCWEWRGERSHEYGSFTLYRDGVDVDFVASRIAWTIANGPIPDGLFVLHRCDNPPCVNPSHLFVGTHADNMADMFAKGRDNTKATENRRKTLCPRCGGEFVESHHASQRTAKGTGRRRCPRCKATWNAKYKKVWKARQLVG